MKIIVDKTNSIVKYGFPDRALVSLTDEQAQVGDKKRRGPELFYDDVNESNSVIYQDVDLPEGYYDNKYKYDGSTWTIVDGWEDPDPGTLNLIDRWTELFSPQETVLKSVEPSEDDAKSLPGGSEFLPGGEFGPKE